jgi:drug/metabolite transporter (DMT)-like permease
MSFFTSGLFWFIAGILACLVILGLREWFGERGLKMAPWKWVLVAGWLVLFGFSLAFIGTCLGEGEPTAAFKGGMLFLLASLLAGAALWRMLKVEKFPWPRKNK